MNLRLFMTFASAAALSCGGETTPTPASPGSSPAAPAGTADSLDTPSAAPQEVTREAASAAAVPGPHGKRAACVLGQDQTCNGDPSVSALWGKCTQSGTCECNAGFELAPTGYCQPIQASIRP